MGIPHCVRGALFEELPLPGDKSNQKRLIHQLKVAISFALSVGAAKTATKTAGKRLQKVEVYIETPDTADDGGGKRVLLGNFLSLWTKSYSPSGET